MKLLSFLFLVKGEFIERKYEITFTILEYKQSHVSVLPNDHIFKFNYLKAIIYMTCPIFVMIFLIVV